jgi:hypothetical protein
MKQRFTKEVFDLLLSKNDYKIRTDLKNKLDPYSDYYELSDGRILMIVLYQSGDGNIFESEQALLNIWHPVSISASSHPLEGLIKEGADFPDYIDKYKADISAILSIDSALLNFSFDSLKIIDQKMKTKGINTETYLQQLFIPSVSYMGETIKRYKQGRWTMIFISAYNVWEPFIELTDKRKINIFTDLYDYANEDFDNFSIYYTAQLRLDTL